ncbi:uncharacterized protein [Rutidosis leptorrhynchoides]|uniref:uncharacterized protein n=1 Tax=Rutidosis leptorrhynchoides TaxID=125765 RepID=UPI003A998D47
MSALSKYPEAINTNKDVQIWNNAVFDNAGDSECFKSNNLIKSPSLLLKKPPVSINPCSDSYDSSFSSKENQSPIGLSNCSVLVHQSKQKPKPLKNLEIKSGSLKSESREEKTDEEIEIEKEISRLYAKLESIRSKKAAEQKENKVLEKQGKKVTAKFLDPVKDSGVKKMEESGFSKPKIQRRGFSLGPNEIMNASNSKAKQIGTTPVQSTNRRKSCFWKLDDIEEENYGFSKGRNSILRQAVTTVGSKKGIKKDDLILASVQPKKLFGDQSVPAKKPLKPGRVIASRYNQPTVNSTMKKKSFTDNVDRKSRGGTEGRMKKKWEIPSFVIPKRLELEDDNETENDEFVGPIDVVMPVELPRIRAVRFVDDQGRDSGPAKRVAELVGKKSYFHEDDDDDEEETVCQQLSFEED